MENISQIEFNIRRIQNEINENKEYQELRHSIRYNHCRFQHMKMFYLKFNLEKKSEN